MTARFVPAQGVRALTLGGRSLLHAEHGQTLVELNPTADRIWRSLAASGSVRDAAGELAALGLPLSEALRMVEDCAQAWTFAGHLAPRALDELLARPPSRTLVIDGVAVDLRLDGVDWAPLHTVFGHLCGAARQTSADLSVIAHGGRLLFYRGRKLALVGEPDGLAAHLKAQLTELYIDGVAAGFLAHAALIERDGRRLLLTGEPGAGKTTLTMALAATGWRFGGDDIVRITPDGQVRGAPFAATIKSGALPLLTSLWPQLDVATGWRRGDGQIARYLLPPATARGAGRIDAVVLLARRAEAAAHAAPISPVEALGVLLEGGYARRWQMTGEALEALAEGLEQARCLRLTYWDLPAAVRAIEESLDVSAQAA